ncbi:MAG TPA: S9 family peptidase [Acidimicrobiales bacterium]
MRYGSWPSPITAELVVQGAATITEVVVDGDDVWWAEARPTEGGRVAVLRRDRSGAIREVAPPDANVRTRVHEYGGGAWWVRDGVLVYSDHADQQLRRIDPDGSTRELTSMPRARFADGRVTPDGRWYVCVREDHDGSEHEPRNDLVAVAMDGSGTVRSIASGADFYASPRPSPDGTRLAWIQWNHPDMPWDGTELWVADLADGTVSSARCVAGGRDESIEHPEWSADGALHVVSDRDGWWSVYRVDLDAGGAFTLVRGGAFDIGGPMWVFGESPYAVLADGTVVVDHDLEHVMSDPSTLRARGDRVVAAGASWDRESHVVEVRRGDGVEVLRPPRDLGLDPALFPPPEQITFPTGDGEVAHGWFYRPANPAAQGPPDERPPLLVLVHGGPTSAARRSLHLPLRFWTSRGIAVVDVDYRGSTGYGRAYRRALDGRWGVADVEDAVNAARWLAARGEVDGSRLLIRGGSAGGFTVLCALTFHDVFAAGASHHGIADLEALVRDTHKFESRYLDRLVAPYPEQRDVYVARSPIHHTERLSAPMIVLQGADDRVVPPNQAEMLVAALREKGIPHEYLLFEGEGHGFRRAENIVRALEAELAFYARVLGFTPA